MGRIKEDDPLRQFDGYSDKKATDKKIIRDVFVKGDMVYASGDLLYMDDYGYLYFRDRTGDTFRWKGENVSTTELESIISKEAGHVDSVVYAVEIPGNEGKAGMVAIEDPDRKIDVNELLLKLKKQLPSYAIPVLVRIVPKLHATSTLKLQKNVAQKEGFDLSVVKDPVYLLDKAQTKYTRLEGDLYDRLCQGKISL